MQADDGSGLFCAGSPKPAGVSAQNVFDTLARASPISVTAVSFRIRIMVAVSPHMERNCIDFIF